MGIREIENGEFVCITNGGGMRYEPVKVFDVKSEGDRDTFYARTTQIEFKHFENQ